MSAHAFSVQATKKGGAPLFLEKRKYGKTVTILPLSSVKGDAESLCTQLKNALGTGGTTIDNRLELQGDKLQAAEDWLQRAGVLRGAQKPPIVEPATQEQAPLPSQREEPRTKPRHKACSSGSSGSSSSSSSLQQPSPAAIGTAKTFKAGSTPYGRFVALMQGWQYWDHDYSQLPHRWDEHRRLASEHRAVGGGELEGGMGAGLEEALRHAVEGALSKGGGGDSRGLLVDAGLRVLGMLSERCVHGESRAERLQKLTQRRREAKATGASAMGTSASASSMPTAAGHPGGNPGGSCSAAGPSGGGRFSSRSSAHAVPVWSRAMRDGQFGQLTVLAGGASGGTNAGGGKGRGRSQGTYERSRSSAQGRGRAGLSVVSNRGSVAAATSVARRVVVGGGGNGKGAARRQLGGSRPGYGGSDGDDEWRWQEDWMDDDDEDDEGEGGGLGASGGAASSRALDDFWLEAVARKNREAAGSAHRREQMRAAQQQQQREWRQPSLEDDEDADLQLALALSASEANAAAWPIPSAGQADIAPARLGGAAPTRSHGPQLSPFLSQIEARLEAQRQAWLREHGEEVVVLPSQSAEQNAMAAGRSDDDEAWGKGGNGRVAVMERRPHMSCEEMWGGELSEEEALALAIRLSGEEQARKEAEAEGEWREEGEEEWWEEAEGEWWEGKEEEQVWEEGEEEWWEEAEEVPPQSAAPRAASLRIIPSAPEYTDDDFAGEGAGAPTQPPLRQPPSRVPPGLTPGLTPSLPPGLSSAHPPGVQPSAAAGHAEERRAETPEALRAWALGELEALLSAGGETAGGTVCPDVLLEYVMSEEEEGALIDYLTAFIGEEAVGFGVELVERRRRLQK